MSVTNCVYVMLRVDSEGLGYDNDYPIEAVFLSLEEAVKYRDDLIRDMRENEEIEEDSEDDDLFEIVSRPLVNEYGQENYQVMYEVLDEQTNSRTCSVW